MIRVSLVSKDDPPRPHPHSLVGRDCNNGICQITIDPSCQMQGLYVFVTNSIFVLTRLYKLVLKIVVS